MTTGKQHPYRTYQDPSRIPDGMIISQPIDSSDLAPPGARAINSKEGAKKEKSKRKIREDRERKRVLAENRANDAVVEARENLADYRKTRLLMFITLAIGTGVLSLSAIMDTLWAVVPLIAGGVLMILSGIQIGMWSKDRTAYNLQAEIRRLENSHRDIINRSIEYYDGVRE